MASEKPTVSDEQAFEDWEKSPKNRPIVFMTVGRSGVGKSTLINAILQLEGDEKAIVGMSTGGGQSMTKKVKRYCKERNGVMVNIFDTPPLGNIGPNKDEERRQTIAEVTAYTEGKLDAVFFCQNILPGTRIDNADIEVIKALTTAYGSQIWENTILVLTFSNKVGEFGKSDDLKTFAAHRTSEFNSALKKAGVRSVSAKSIMEHTGDFKGIPAVPVGQTPDDRLAHSENWIASLYLEVLKKCDPESVPHLFEQNTGKLGKKIVATGFGVAGAGIGAAICGFVGTFLLPGPGTIIGASVGAAFFGGLSGAATGGKIHDEIYSDTSEINKKVDVLKKKIADEKELEKYKDKFGKST